jgi:hypothetical protein
LITSRDRAYKLKKKSIKLIITNLLLLIFN